MYVGFKAKVKEKDMVRRFSPFIMAVCAIISVGTLATASMADDESADQQHGWVPSNYPGLMTKDEVWYLTTMFVQNGVQAYYFLHRDWPRRWQDVVDEGLVTVKLETPWGKPVDPDDDQIDFDYDVVYHYSVAGPQMLQSNHNSSPQVHILRFTTSKHNLPEIAERHPELKAWLDNAYRRKQLAVANVTFTCLTQYGMFMHRVPFTWSDFQQSGFCPLAPNTVNPMTGVPWAFDGRPNDFTYSGTPEKQMSLFYATDESGKMFWPVSY